MRAIFNLRESISGVLEKVRPDLRHNIHPEKQDMVESYPVAAVYVEPVEVELVSMGGGFESVVEYTVSIYRTGEKLADTFAKEVEDIAKAIFTNRGSWPDGVKSALVSGFSTQYTKDSRGREGVLNITITADIISTF